MLKILNYLKNRIGKNIPICDRCLDVDKKQTRVNFINYFFKNINNFVYCDLCWNWINLKKWVDKDGNKRTLRTKNS